MRLGKRVIQSFSRTGANTSGLSTFTKGSAIKIEDLDRTGSMIKTSSYGIFSSSLGNSFNLPHHRTKFKDIVIASYSTRSKGQDDKFPRENSDSDSTELSAEERKDREEYEKLTPELKEVFEKLSREIDLLDKPLREVQFTGPIYAGAITDITDIYPDRFYLNVSDEELDRWNVLLRKGFDDKLKSLEEIDERAEAAKERAKTSKLGEIFKLKSPKVDTSANRDGDDPKAEQREKNKEPQDEKAEEDSSTRPSNN